MGWRWSASTMVGLGVLAFSGVDTEAGEGQLPSRFRLKDESCQMIGVALGVPSSQRAMPGELNSSSCKVAGSSVTCEMTSQGGQGRTVGLEVDTNAPPLVFLSPKGGINFVYIDLELRRYSWTHIQMDFEKKASFTKQCTGAFSPVK